MQPITQIDSESELFKALQQAKNVLSYVDIYISNLMMVGIQSLCKGGFDENPVNIKKNDYMPLKLADVLERPTGKFIPDDYDHVKHLEISSKKPPYFISGSFVLYIIKYLYEGRMDLHDHTIPELVDHFDSDIDIFLFNLNDAERETVLDDIVKFNMIYDVGNTKKDPEDRISGETYKQIKSREDWDNSVAEDSYEFYVSQMMGYFTSGLGDTFASEYEKFFKSYGKDGFKSYMEDTLRETFRFNTCATKVMGKFNFIWMYANRTDVMKIVDEFDITAVQVAFIPSTELEKMPTLRIGKYFMNAIANKEFDLTSSGYDLLKDEEAPKWMISRLQKRVDKYNQRELIYRGKHVERAY